MDTEQGSRPFYRRHKGAILLVTLLLLILLSPVGQNFKDSKLMDMILATVVMAASLHAISYRKRSTIYFAVGLATLAVISGWMQVASEANIHDIFSHSFASALYAYIAVLLFKVILLEDEITTDQIFAAVAIYIFIGLTWGHLYALANTFHPGSFVGIPTHAADSISHFIFFSFITLTTLGYGDILPNTSITRALAIVEAVTGVMFVAILVATLVGRVNVKS